MNGDRQTTSSTLLAALWAVEAETAEEVTREALKAGAIKLTGNFRGREREVAGG